MPLLRTFLGGSAGSGKATTLKTIVQHVRLLFMKRGVPAKVEITAFTDYTKTAVLAAGRTHQPGGLPQHHLSVQHEGKQAPPVTHSSRWKWSVARLFSTPYLAKRKSIR